MRTRKIILTACQDSELGGIGYLLPGMNRDGINPARDGLTIAHDLLEHQNGTELIGTIDDELEALGGIWFVRGQHGELNRDGAGSYYSVHENISSDIVRMFRDFFYGANVDTKAPRTMPCNADDDFEEILKCAANAYESEIDDENAADVAKRFEEYKRVCLPRMRIGYRKAVKRFKAIDSINRFNANNLFWLIADATDRHAKHAEYEGHQIELTYGMRDNQLFAYCDEVYSEEY